MTFFVLHILSSSVLADLALIMMYSLGLAALAALAVAAPSSTVENRDNLQARAACASAVTVAPGSNIFALRTLHANSAYASEISAAMANVTDTSIIAQASQVAQVGTFLWM
jgi:cellulose 1,4-beta-cellobiosidase